MVSSGIVVIILLSSVTGLEDHKRILMSDPNYTHELEVKVQELTAKVDAMSTREYALEAKVQELTTNLSKLLSQNGKPTVSGPDHCPNGYIRMNKSCYKIHHDQMTWPEASAFCREFDSHLVTLETRDEYNFLKEKLVEFHAAYQDDASYWTSGSDAVLDGQWMWTVTGSPAKDLVWAPGKPDGATDSNCISFYGDDAFSLDDAPCLRKYNPICEMDLIT